MNCIEGIIDFDGFSLDLDPISVLFSTYVIVTNNFRQVSMLRIMHK